MDPGASTFYGPDLAAIHAAGFTAVAGDAATHLLARLAPGARVVDLGCGDGTTAARLSAAGHRVHGVDLSPHLVSIARRKAPEATFAVGSLSAVELPAECDAILAVGEVFGYLFDAAPQASPLAGALGRCARALRAGGLLLFDLAGHGRVGPGGGRTWTEGDGWIVAVDAREDGRRLTRRIVTLTGRGDGAYRRSEEVHEQRLYEPSEVLAHLSAAGLAGRPLAGGYGGTTLPPGVTAYEATRGESPGRD